MTAAILVYHRVPADVPRAYHDVPLGRFQDQLAMLAPLVERVDGPTLILGGGRRVLLTFDDGTAGHAEAAQALDRYGWAGIFFVVAGRMGEAGRLSRAAVADLAARGHVVASHGMTHARFDRMTPQQLGVELARSQEILAAVAGQPVRWLAPPGGACPPGLPAAARAAGFEHVRSMRWGYAGSDLSGLLPGLPVHSHTGNRAFMRLVSGRAPLWAYRLKEAAKAMAGETLFDRVREFVRPRGSGTG